MPLLLQILITGLAAGAVYGLVAIGTSLIYRLTGVIHFALGELVSLAIFGSLLALGGTAPIARGEVGTGTAALAVLAGLAVATLAGAVTYVAAVRPLLRRGSALGWIGGLLVVAFGVRGALASSFPRPFYVFPDPFGLDRVAEGGVLSLGGGVTVPVRAFAVIVVGIGLAWLAAWVLDRTEVGRALRAISMDRVAARLAGLPVEALVTGAFAAAGAFAALAAVVHAPSAPISVETGALLGLKGLVAALLAGFGSPWRSFAAGLALGVGEAAVASWSVLGAAYRDVLPLALVVIVLAAGRARLRERGA